MYRALCCSLPANFLLLSSGVILTYISSFLTLSPWRFALFTQTPSSFCHASVSLKFVLPKKIYFSKLNFRTHRSTFGVFILYFVFLFGWLCSWLLRAASQYSPESALFFLFPLWWRQQRRLQLAVFRLLLVGFYFRVLFGVSGKKLYKNFVFLRKTNRKRETEEGNTL